DLARVASLLEPLFERTFEPHERGHEKIHVNCARILMELALWHNEPRSLAFVDRVIHSPGLYHNVLCHVAFHLGEGLCSARSGVAPKAFQYLDRILESLLAASTKMEKERESS